MTYIDIGLPRRAGIVTKLGAVVGCFFVLFGARAGAQDITVTLLGTGSPPPVMDRFGPSTLVEAGGQRFLFDAGRGALQRLAQLKIGWQDVDGIFLTHLHSDHVVGLPDLWLTGWLVGPGRTRPLEVWGPSGTRAMMGHLEQAFAFDIAVRQSDDRAAREGIRVIAADIARGVVLEKAGVRITTFEVDHDPVEPALGYRVDYGGRSLVLSGDTRLSDAVIEQATGVDVLIHEVVDPESLARSGISTERAASVAAHHVTPQQAAAVFARAKPRLAVYSHIVPPGALAEDLLAATRDALADLDYTGTVLVGEDLMVIRIGERIEWVRHAP